MVSKIASDAKIRDGMDGYVKRGPKQAEVRRAMDLNIEEEKKKGKPVKTWEETVMNDIRKIGMKDEPYSNR